MCNAKIDIVLNSFAILIQLINCARIYGIFERIFSSFMFLFLFLHSSFVSFLRLCFARGFVYNFSTSLFLNVIEQCVFAERDREGGGAGEESERGTVSKWGLLNIEYDCFGEHFCAAHQQCACKF